MPWYFSGSGTAASGISYSLHSASATEDSAVSPEARKLVSDSWPTQQSPFEATCSTLKNKNKKINKATFLYNFTSHLNFLCRPTFTQNLTGRAYNMRVPYLQSHHNVLYILCLNWIHHFLSVAVQQVPCKCLPAILWLPCILILTFVMYHSIPEG